MGQIMSIIINNHILQTFLYCANMKTRSDFMKRFLGSMLGGAVGDALGYAVEFKGINEIRQIYAY